MSGPLAARGRAVAVLAVAISAAVLVLASLWLLGGPRIRSELPHPGPTAQAGGAAQLDSRADWPGAGGAARAPIEEAATLAERRPARHSPAAALPRGVPRLRVRVQSPDGKPLSAAVVAARVNPALQAGTAPARGLSDAQGSCTVEVPELETMHLFELAAHALVVEVSCEGYQPHLWRLRLDQLFQPDFELRAILQRGAGAVGRVLDRAGAPVAEASVTLLRTSEESDRELEVIARTSSAADGTFQAGFAPHDGRVLFLATHPAHGTAQREVPVSGALRTEVGDLQLQAAGELAGRVLFPDGSPARRAEVRAAPAQSRGPPRGFPGAQALTGGRVLTDEQGRFRFALLEPGVYRLDAGNPYRAGSEPAQDAYSTPTHDVLLQATHVALCVRVVDPDGRALAGVGVDARRVRVEHDASPAGGERLALVDRQRALTRGDPPVAVLAVDPADRVVLRIELPACHPAQALVSARDVPGEQPVTLELWSRAQAVRVLPRVTDAARGKVSEYCIDVFDPYTRLLVRSDLAPGEDGALPALAPGTWLLQARPPARPAHATGPLPAGLGATVDLRPDGPQVLELRLD